MPALARSEANVSRTPQVRLLPRCSNSRHDLVCQPAHQFPHHIHGPCPLRHWLHNSPVNHVGMALLHSTPVNNVPDRRLLQNTIEMTPQSTVRVANDKPVPNQLKSSVQAHIPKCLKSQVLSRIWTGPSRPAEPSSRIGVDNSPIVPAIRKDQSAP